MELLPQPGNNTWKYFKNAGNLFSTVSAPQRKPDAGLGPFISNTHGCEDMGLAGRPGRTGGACGHRNVFRIKNKKKRFAVNLFKTDV